MNALFITSMEYEESVWMKAWGGRGRSALYVGCVYMPTDSTSVAAVDAGYVRLKEDVLTFGWWCLVISMLELVDL